MKIDLGPSGDELAGATGATGESVLMGTPLPDLPGHAPLLGDLAVSKPLADQAPDVPLSSSEALDSSER